MEAGFGRADTQNKKGHPLGCPFSGARGGSRTRTPLRALAPEASESTNSTTRASDKEFCSSGQDV